MFLNSRNLKDYFFLILLNNCVEIVIKVKNLIKTALLAGDWHMEITLIFVIQNYLKLMSFFGIFDGNKINTGFFN